MALRAELEEREARCSEVGDFVVLAAEALAEPADPEYARSLLEKAEGQCQLPNDYLKVGETAAGVLKDSDYARSIYDQAEEMLFDVQEHIDFARSVAVHLGDEERARVCADKAAGDARTATEHLALAALAEDVLGASELAEQQRAAVESTVKDLAGLSKLTNELIASGNHDAAVSVYKKGARYCDDMQATVAYAKQTIELFEDPAWAREVLQEAEMECQFTKDFVLLAQAFQDLLDDKDTVTNLLEQAAEFCMTGEEHVDLADGYWRLQQDVERARESYRKAIADISDKTVLLEIAGRVAKELEDIDLAKEFYAKTEQRMSSPKELSGLAKAVVEDLGDKEYAASIYDRAAEGLSNPGDLTTLAGDIITHLDDRERASQVYRRAFERGSDHKQLSNLAKAVHDQLGEQDFVAEILGKATDAAVDTPSLVTVAKLAFELEQTDTARRALTNAEERVTSLGEIQSVVEAVANRFPDDGEWNSRVKEKLSRREANQAKYSEFQNREAKATGPLKLMRLAQAVMHELEDPFYARKLLSTAEQQWVEGGHELSLGRELVLAVDRLLDEPHWVQTLLDTCVKQCPDLSALQAIARVAASELRDTAAGKKLARAYYESFESGLDSAQANAVYTRIKIAKVIIRDLGDDDWARRVVAETEPRNEAPLANAELGLLAAQLGDTKLAEGLYEQAFQACKSPRQLRQLVAQLKAGGVEPDTLSTLYENVKERLTEPMDKLHWAEGIVDLFGETEKASMEYAELASQMTTVTHRARLEVSRSARLARKLY